MISLLRDKSFSCGTFRGKVLLFCKNCETDLQIFGVVVLKTPEKQRISGGKGWFLAYNS